MALFELMADVSDEGCGPVFASLRDSLRECQDRPFDCGNRALAYHLTRRQHFVRLQLSSMMRIWEQRCIREERRGCKCFGSGMDYRNNASER